MNSRRSALIAICLICVLLIGLGFTLYFYGKWTYAESSLLRSLMELQWLKSTVLSINATAPRISLNLTFTPIPPVKAVAPDTITFLLGYVIISNITGIFYPATLIANFTVTHSSPANTTVHYSYIPYQTVFLTQGIDRIEIPWGIFPLEIHGQLGDQIFIHATVRVQIIWTYVNAVMADQQTTITYLLYVGK